MTPAELDRIRRYVADVAERVVWTFVQGASAVFVGTYSAAALDDWSSAKRVASACAVGGFAAVLSLIKGLAAKKIGADATAALLPARLDSGA